MRIGCVAKRLRRLCPEGVNELDAGAATTGNEETRARTNILEIKDERALLELRPLALGKREGSLLF